MTNDECRRTTEVPANRREPIGEPVIRDDPAVTDSRAREAVGLGPTDPNNLVEAVRTTRSFSKSATDDDDHVLVLRGAAARAALVHGVGLYKCTAERAGDDVSVSFIRKWVRVHDLLQLVRRHAARGRIAPTAAKHIARVSDDTRLYPVWTTLDAGLTVREVRRLASKVNDGTLAVDVLTDHGVDTGRFDVTLLVDVYLKLRRRVSFEDAPPGDIVANALDNYLD